ncbi:Long chain acyl-CoA synthetase 7 peroxisomal [Nowakowskiella sp. JEL0407]|nr:Long chain acyl-CoA synthetase 7 peroxisomal [Nowakowskiella sp. JEL0407]
MSPELLSVEVADAPEIPGETKPRRSAAAPSGPLIKGMPGASTLHEHIVQCAAKYGDHPFLGKRIITDGVVGPYVFETYSEVFERMKNISSFLVKYGIKPRQNVGLFSINRPEWVVSEYGSFGQGICTVPLYDTLGADAVEFIIGETDLPLVFATKDKVKFLLGLMGKSAKLKTIKYMIAMDDAPNELVQQGKSLGVQVISFSDAENIGKASPAPFSPPLPDDLATICYTSGTTGSPKGVLITHMNMLGFGGSILHLMKSGRMYKFSERDSYVSYLPLAHVMERELMLVVSGVGARIGFYQGDTQKLLDDVVELKPTIFASVPRLFNRVYDRIMQGVNAKGGVAKMLFDFAYAAKKRNLANGYITHMLWDNLIFGAVRARLGGRVKVIVSGSAPILPDIKDFLRICFSAEIFEGYGQTETAAALTVDFQHDYLGTGGIVLPCAEVKLRDVPSMNYSSKDKPYARGEIMVRGTNLFIGYHNEPEKTAETIEKDGWAHTGDIGQFDAQGRLQIIDRLKNIFKLSQGEYVAPEKVEMTLIKHELIAQAFVYGDSLQSTIVAVLVPDEHVFMKWATSEYGERTFAEHCVDPIVVKAVLKQMDTFCRQEGLKGFEIIKGLHLEPVLFSMENGLYTPSFKLRRHDAKVYYNSVIEKLYAEMK